MEPQSAGWHPEDRRGWRGLSAHARVWAGAAAQIPPAARRSREHCLPCLAPSSSGISWPLVLRALRLKAGAQCLLPRAASPGPPLDCEAFAKATRVSGCRLGSSALVSPGCPAAHRVIPKVTGHLALRPEAGTEGQVPLEGVQFLWDEGEQSVCVPV